MAFLAARAATAAAESDQCMGRAAAGEWREKTRD